MKKFAKMLAMSCLFAGGMLIAAPAFAQNEAAAPQGEKSVTKSEVVTATPAKTCAGASAAKACCASKGSAHASAGEVKASSGNAGAAPSATCTKSASSCSHSKAMGGEVSETSANAGTAKASKKNCETGKKCCASKKAEAQ